MCKMQNYKNTNSPKYNHCVKNNEVLHAIQIIKDESSKIKLRFMLLQNQIGELFTSSITWDIILDILSICIWFTENTIFSYLVNLYFNILYFIQNVGWIYPICAHWIILICGTGTVTSTQLYLLCTCKESISGTPCLFTSDRQLCCTVLAPPKTILVQASLSRHTELVCFNLFPFFKKTCYYL